MQELIQKIVNSLIPLTEKKQMIDDAANLLKGFFVDRDEKSFKAILEDNRPLLHAIRLSREAHNISHHARELSSLRVRVNSILISAIRDLKSAKEIIDHLSGDFDGQIKLDREDEVIYNADLSIFHAIRPNPDYNKAIFYSQRALKLSEPEKGMSGEKLRLFSNLIQYHTLQGLLDECEPFIKRAEKLFTLSDLQLNKPHYVFVAAKFLLSRGEIQKAIDFIDQHKGCLERRDSSPFTHFSLSLQLAEACLKNGNVKSAVNVLALTGRRLREFYKSENNHFFCKLYVLEAVSKFSDPGSFLEAKALLLKALKIYEKIYNGSDRHCYQAFAHLQLGKLYHLHKQHSQAKTHYLDSEEIFDRVLKNRKIDDVSELYKSLAILGADMEDDHLTHIYAKKQIDIFGVGHPKTNKILLYLDGKGLALPF